MGPFSRPENGPQTDPRPLARKWRHKFVTKRGFGNDYRKSYDFLYQKTIGIHNQKRHQKQHDPIEEHPLLVVSPVNVAHLERMFQNGGSGLLIFRKV